MEYHPPTMHPTKTRRQSSVSTWDQGIPSASRPKTSLLMSWLRNQHPGALAQQGMRLLRWVHLITGGNHQGNCLSEGGGGVGYAQASTHINVAPSLRISFHLACANGQPPRSTRQAGGKDRTTSLSRSVDSCCTLASSSFSRGNELFVPTAS